MSDFIYVVRSNGGEWEDRWSLPLKAFKTEENAQDFIINESKKNKDRFNDVMSRKSSIKSNWYKFIRNGKHFSTETAIVLEEEYHIVMGYFDKIHYTMEKIEIEE